MPADALPGELRTVASEIEGRSGAPVRIVDLGETVGLPVFMAQCQPRSEPLGIYGGGCSPDSTYALERSLTELLQLVCDPERPYLLANKHFALAIARRPALARLVLVRNERCELVDIPPSALAEGSLLKDVFELVLDHLECLQLTPVFRVTSPPGLCVVTVAVYLPAGERFFLARVGHDVRSRTEMFARRL